MVIFFPDLLDSLFDCSAVMEDVLGSPLFRFISSDIVEEAPVVLAFINLLKFRYIYDN